LVVWGSLKPGLDVKKKKEKKYARTDRPEQLKKNHFLVNPTTNAALHCRLAWGAQPTAKLGYKKKRRGGRRVHERSRGNKKISSTGGPSKTG